MINSDVNKSLSKDFLKDIEKNIAFSIPELKNLSTQQIEEIAKLVIVEQYKEEMKKDVDLMKYDYQELKEIFINNISRTNSINTKKTYLTSFNHFESYLKENDFENPLKLLPAQFDDWIYSLTRKGYSNNTVRQNVVALSSFYSFVERRSNGLIRNGFIGTKARPKKNGVKETKFYSIAVNESKLNRFADDINKIIENVVNPEFKLIIKMTMETGLRAGAFQNMSFVGNKYKTTSKGKEISGYISDKMMKEINKTGLNHKNIFQSWNQNKISCLFLYYTKHLFASGVIENKYSFHDLRHYFAIKEYLSHKDIHKLSKQLNHTSIAITEQYLKGLNVID